VGAEEEEEGTRSGLPRPLLRLLCRDDDLCLDPLPSLSRFLSLCLLFFFFDFFLDARCGGSSSSSSPRPGISPRSITVWPPRRAPPVRLGAPARLLITTSAVRTPTVQGQRQLDTEGRHQR
jgi:hypothetical protein